MKKRDTAAGEARLVQAIAQTVADLTIEAAEFRKSGDDYHASVLDDICGRLIAMRQAALNDEGPLESFVCRALAAGVEV